MVRLANFSSRVFLPLWQALRDWCGDSAYDRYLRAARRQRHAATLSRKAFYLEQLERRYSRPSRCC
jgi:uncharacterized short protein YbdD (DUF466 family)